MIKRMIIMLFAVGLVLFLIFGYKTFGGIMMKRYFASVANVPTSVSTVTAHVEDWQPDLRAVASLKSEKGADLSLQVGGVVESISFNSGDTVAAGTVLLTLRAHDDIAKLHALEAQADLADITNQRDEKQLKVQAVSQAVVDTDAANLRNAKALAAQQQALVEEKVLRAPFSGRLGIRQVDLGQYLNPGTAVVNLQNLDSIVADFWLPQEALAQIAVGQSVSAHVDTFPDQDFTGELIAINPMVSTDSRNVQVRAHLNNADHKLLPGMFAQVTIAIGKPASYVTLPQTVLAYNPYGTTAYIVQNKGGADAKSQLVAQQVFVTTGDTRGDQVAILKGLKEGDVVVSAGQLKLRNGAFVTVNNTVQPANDANPHPQDQ